MLIVCTIVVHMLIVIMPEKRLSSNCGKMTKSNLRIISKPSAHLQTMTKTPVKFQKNQHKTVGGVAHTRYPLSMVKMPEKFLSSTCGKSDKN